MVTRVFPRLMSVMCVCPCFLLVHSAYWALSHSRYNYLHQKEIKLPYLLRFFLREHFRPVDPMGIQFDDELCSKTFLTSLAGTWRNNYPWTFDKVKLPLEAVFVAFFNVMRTFRYTPDWYQVIKRRHSRMRFGALKTNINSLNLVGWSGKKTVRKYYVYEYIRFPLTRKHAELFFRGRYVLWEVNSFPRKEGRGKL